MRASSAFGTGAADLCTRANCLFWQGVLLFPLGLAVFDGSSDLVIAHGVLPRPLLKVHCRTSVTPQPLLRHDTQVLWHRDGRRPARMSVVCQAHVIWQHYMAGTHWVPFGHSTLTFLPREAFCLKPFVL